MKFILAILFICIFTWGQAQNPLGGIGQWRSHYSNRNIQHIVEGDDIYVASQNQIIKLDQKLNLSWIDKSTGLHDIGIASLTWDGNNKQLLVTYQNSNIDILQGDQVFNINAIQLTSLYPNKKINSIEFI